MSLRKPIFISEQGYSQEMDGYADSINLNAIQVIDAQGVAKVSMDGASGDLSAAGVLNVAGDGYFAQALSVDGYGHFAQNLEVAGDGYFAGSIQVAEGADISCLYGRNVFIGNNTDGFPAIQVDDGGMLAVKIESDMYGGHVVLQRAIEGFPETVNLSANGSLTLGATDVAGMVSVKNASDAEVFRLDGATGEATLASAIVSDLTETRIVFAGENGALVDDPSLSFVSSVGGPGTTKSLSVKTTDESASGYISVLSAGGDGVSKLRLDGLDSAIQIDANGMGDNGEGGDQIRFWSHVWDPTKGGRIRGLSTARVLEENDATTKGYVDGLVNAASDASFSDFVAAEALALGNPVFIDANGKAAKAEAISLNDEAAWVMGVARAAAAAADDAVEVVRDGVLAGALTGLSFAAADQIWLGVEGGLVNARPTASGARLILVGFAKTADDLFVDIRDYGKNV